jgi:hypothetical protein
MAYRHGLPDILCISSPRTICSPKFWVKLKIICTLDDLAQHVQLDQIDIPQPVEEYVCTRALPSSWECDGRDIVSEHAYVISNAGTMSNADAGAEAHRRVAPSQAAGPRGLCLVRYSAR